MRVAGIAAALLCAAACSFAAPRAAAAGSVPADSLNNAVADFVTGNMQHAIGSLIEQTRSLGLEVDSAALVRQVAERISRPYDEERYHAAVDYLNQAVERTKNSENQAFLDAAKARPGAQELEGGLILEVIQPGEGPTVRPSDTVVFHYTGKLPDGTEFDSSFDGAPLRSSASNLVTGMTNGLTHMQASGKYRLTIPAELGYGSRGAAGVIPPDTPLEFYIELLEIVH